MYKTALNGRPSPIALVSRKNNPKHYRNYFDCDLHGKSNYETFVIASPCDSKAKQSKSSESNQNNESITQKRIN